MLKKIKNKFFRKILIKSFIAIFFNIFTLNFVEASNFIYTHNSEKIKISKVTYNKFIEYKKGIFYSKTYDKKFLNAKGMYFALSENGNSSVFSFCEDDVLGCVSNLLKYQTLKKCEKVANEKCYIISIKNYIHINKKKILTEAKNLDKIFLIQEHNNISKSDDIRARTLSEFENSEPYE